MGDVYRARDARLGRDVALKTLPPVFASDPERLARFEREAKTLAVLSHPNIAQIYGVEEIAAPGGEPAMRALVMELLEGEDLSARINRGPIPVAEALEIARQIAAGLAAAHESGIIHRDLKPDNIKISEQGDVKVFDFGLAKFDPSADGFDGITVTGKGIIVGTASYMAPEQAKGKPVDKRVDVWAFGIVLFEMLTGRRAFPGKAIPEIIAAVLKDPPPLDMLPADTPAGIRRLLRRCLEKDRKHRLDSMRVVRSEIEDAIKGPAPTPTLSALTMIMTRPTWDRRAIAATVLGAVTIAGMGAAAYYRLATPAPLPVMRFAITPPAGVAFENEINQPDIALTPDQRRVVIWTKVDGIGQYVVRPINSFESAALTGLGEVPRGVTVSPDSKWLMYQTGASGGQDAMLHKVPITGGAPAEIGGIDGNLRGASWQADGTIVYATGNMKTGLMSIPAAGGTPTILSVPDGPGGELDHLWPHTLPGGQKVIFAVRRANQGSDIAVLDRTTGTWRVVVKNGTYPRYLRNGYLLYASGATLYAVSFNAESATVSGEPQPVVEGLAIKGSGAANFDVSPAGTLVYMEGSSPRRDAGLMWVDRAGAAVAIKVPRQEYLGGDLSPDGKRAVVGVMENGAAAAWMVDVTTGAAARLTPRGWSISSAIWSPDGMWVAFEKLRGGTEANGIFRVAANGGGALERVTTAPAGVLQPPSSWTPDGGAILFTQTDGPSVDIMRVTIGSSQIAPVLSGPSPEGAGLISPDGRWLAYLSSESGRREAYVRPYPNVADHRVQVSLTGASTLLWNPGGTELVYLDPDGVPFRIPVAPGSRFTAADISPVFRDAGTATKYQLTAIAPGDGRFLALDRAEPPRTTPDYRVVVNWFEELVAKMQDSGR